MPRTRHQHQRTHHTLPHPHPPHRPLLPTTPTPIRTPPRNQTTTRIRHYPHQYPHTLRPPHGPGRDLHMPAMWTANRSRTTLGFRRCNTTTTCRARAGRNRSTHSARAPSHTKKTRTFKLQPCARRTHITPIPHRIITDLRIDIHPHPQGGTPQRGYTGTAGEAAKKFVRFKCLHDASNSV